MRNVAIIPARSGSKGLKDKNIRPLAGKPLLAYSIEAAKAAGMFDEIMVSTDSKKYAKIAEEYGAKVPFLRSEELSSDTASSWDVIKDILKRYEGSGKIFDTFTLLQPTSPLRTGSDIAAAYEVMKDKEANAVISVCEVDHSPLWTNVLPPDGSLQEFFNITVYDLPRQKLPVYYRLNGAVYIAKVPYFMESGNIYEDKCYAYIMDRKASVDIDEEFDFVIAEAIMKAKLSD